MCDECGRPCLEREVYVRATSKDKCRCEGHVFSCGGQAMEVKHDETKVLSMGEPAF